MIKNVVLCIQHHFIIANRGSGKGIDIHRKDCSYFALLSSGSIIKNHAAI